MISLKEVKEHAKIDVLTGRAVIPEYDDGYDETYRELDLKEGRDTLALMTLHRRINVLEAMNTIIRLANNEDISLGSWLYYVEDEARGVEFAEYTNDHDFFEIVELFRDIVKDATVRDLAW